MSRYKQMLEILLESFEILEASIAGGGKFDVLNDQFCDLMDHCHSALATSMPREARIWKDEREAMYTTKDSLASDVQSMKAILLGFLAGLEQ